MDQPEEEKESGLEMEVPVECLDDVSLTSEGGLNKLVINVMNSMVKITICAQDATQNEVLAMMKLKLDRETPLKLKVCV